VFNSRNQVEAIILGSSEGVYDVGAYAVRKIGPPCRAVNVLFLGLKPSFGLFLGVELKSLALAVNPAINNPARLIVDLPFFNSHEPIIR